VYLDVVITFPETLEDCFKHLTLIAAEKPARNLINSASFCAMGWII